MLGAHGNAPFFQNINLTEPHASSTKTPHTQSAQPSVQQIQNSFSHAKSYLEELCQPLVMHSHENSLIQITNGQMLSMVNAQQTNPQILDNKHLFNQLAHH